MQELAAAVQFDVIVMDPPWQLASACPTRGVCPSAFLLCAVNKILLYSTRLLIL